ncbi:MAG: UDP-N-acetylglucosamine 2-epimerase (non-hydrolyzing) [Wenzhouxiangellaceae bacterium]
MSRPIICVVIGTRPEAIKLAPVISRLQRDDRFECCVLLTGQHREMVDQVMRQFGLRADRDLDIMQPGQSLAEITSRSLLGLEAALAEIRPALVVVQGDTTTAFAASLAAFYLNIEVAHVEAGLRTDNPRDPFPEEVNRRLISQLAALHFAPTAAAARNLEHSGAFGRVLMTGNTVVDALLEMAAREPACDIPELDWNRHRVVLTTIHRRESWGARIEQIARAMLELLERHADLAFLLPLHRNPRVREPLKAALDHHPRVFLVEPLDYAALVGAIQRCYMLMTDSGGLQEEAPSLGKPVLVLRNTTERPEAVEAGTARLIGTESKGIVTAVSALLEDPAQYQAMAQRSNPFGDGHASERIIDEIARYLGV